MILPLPSDSLVDMDNSNYLTLSITKANHCYYGIDFPIHKPTSRFINSKNTANFIAKKLGVGIFDGIDECYCNSLPFNNPDLVTTIINRGLECRRRQDNKVQNCIRFYKRCCDLLRINYGSNFDCAVQRSLGGEAAFAATVLGDNALIEKAWQDTRLLAEAVLHAHAHGRPTLKNLVQTWSQMLQPT